jgi:excisionase family DNA binding protein
MLERLTCEQVAERYGVKLSTVWSWVRKKELAASRFGRRYTVELGDLEKFERSRKTTREEAS